MKKIIIFSCILACCLIFMIPGKATLFYESIFTISTGEIRTWAVKRLMNTTEGIVIVLRSGDAPIVEEALGELYNGFCDKAKIIPEALFDELIRLSVTDSCHQVTSLGISTAASTVFQLFLYHDLSKYNEINIAAGERSLLKALQVYKGIELLDTINLISSTIYIWPCNCMSLKMEGKFLSLKIEIERIQRENKNKDVVIAARVALEIFAIALLIDELAEREGR